MPISSCLRLQMRPESYFLPTPRSSDREFERSHLPRSKRSITGNHGIQHSKRIRIKSFYTVPHGEIRAQSRQEPVHPRTWLEIVGVEPVEQPHSSPRASRGRMLFYPFGTTRHQSWIDSSIQSEGREPKDRSLTRRLNTDLTHSLHAWIVTKI